MLIEDTWHIEKTFCIVYQWEPQLQIKTTSDQLSLKYYCTSIEKPVWSSLEGVQNVNAHS